MSDDSRARELSTSSASYSPTHPNKRAKQHSNKDGDQDNVIDIDSSPQSSPELGSRPDDILDTSCNDANRDPDYYFEDGNAVVRVRTALFKIHASLFRARSEVFKGMFSVVGDNNNNPSGDGKSDEASKGGSPIEGKPVESGMTEIDAGFKRSESTGVDTVVGGSSDSHPIIIQRVEPSEFRNLLKMFYCLPHDPPMISLREKSADEHLWAKFELLLDVARLSHQFAISDMEKWATGELKNLVHMNTEKLADWFYGGTTPHSYIVGAMQHAKAVSIPRLIHDVRYMIQHFCFSSEGQAPLSDILELFRFEGLRQLDEALYGYLFVLLLKQGHSVWESDDFSRSDRTALFSAQVYLTPLPGTLFEGIQSPLYEEVDSVLAFSNKMSSPSTAQSSLDKCYKTAFRAWKAEFNASYYEALASHHFQRATTTLQSLPLYRLRLGHKIRTRSCPHSCHHTILFQVDRDLEKLFARLAGFYKDIK